jgi:hypothetical protein
MKSLRWVVAAALTLGLAALVAVSGRGQQTAQTLQHGFEGRDDLHDIIWQRGSADADYREIDHRLTNETAHTGAKSERIHLEAQKGKFIYYTYAIGRAPVTDELTVSVWVKANRPGVQLLCRVVLPRERDAKDPDQRLTVLLPGPPDPAEPPKPADPSSTYTLVGRWQQLSIRLPVKRLREQQQLLNASLKRQIVTDDAYVDHVFLNVYGGPGETKVWTDDLEVGPLLESRPPDAAAPGREVPGRPALNRRPSEVALKGHRLTVNGDGFFMLGVRHTGTPLKALRAAGFNTVWLDETTPQALVEDAARLGFWIVPTITPPQTAVGRGPEGQLTAANELFGRKVGMFRDSDAVLAYDLGGNVPAENFTYVTQGARAFHAADPLRPLAVDVLDGLQRYARGAETSGLMLGMHRWPLMTGLELPGYRDWLTQRRRLAPPDSFCWTWVQTHLDDWYTTQVYDRPGAGGFNEPVGPQAEQIRLLTYSAVGAGYRGVAFWSDRFLADSHAGRDRLLAMALLNQELQLLEPLLVTAEEPKWIDTSRPEVKAAMLRTEKGVLVLPVWMGAGSQFVPGQGAVSELKITVPAVMGSAQAWEVSPGEVRALKTERVVGGESVTLREFSLTAAVVFTSDLGPNGLIARFQERQRAMLPDAARWAHEQAQEELAKVEKVQAELDEMGVKLQDGDKLLAKSRAFLEACATARRNGDHAEAYLDARRALRPLRILMRAQWDRAVRELDGNPTASPYAVSFFTLPRHWKFYRELTQLRAGASVLPGGDFELPMEQQPPGWVLDNPQPLDDVVMKAARVTAEAKEGKQSLLLEILPRDTVKPPLALERTYLAISSPAVKLPPGSDVQISGWVKVPQKIDASVDGVLLFDSAGGEPLAVRLTEPTNGWKKVTLYRKVPASGRISVSMVMTGLGRAYFDDVRIEPLVPGGAPGQVSAKPR